MPWCGIFPTPMPSTGPSPSAPPPRSRGRRHAHPRRPYLGRHLRPDLRRSRQYDGFRHYPAPPAALSPRSVPAPSPFPARTPTPGSPPSMRARSRSAAPLPPAPRPGAPRCPGALARSISAASRSARRRRSRFNSTGTAGSERADQFLRYRRHLQRPAHAGRPQQHRRQQRQSCALQRRHDHRCDLRAHARRHQHRQQQPSRASLAPPPVP